MTSSEPRVSVVAAVYQCKKFIGEMIESVLRQTYTNWELILVDDASSDGTYEVCLGFAEKDSRIRVFRVPENSGQTQCLNLGVMQARGEWVARIDGDDAMLPERLAKQVAYLEANPKCCILGSFVEIINEAGEPQCLYKMSVSDQILRKQMMRFDPIYHPSVMLRRDILFRVGLYNSRYRYAQDYDLWIRMIQLGRVEVLPEILLRYRVVGSGISRKTLRGQSFETILILMDAVLKGYHPVLALRHIWKPLVYVLAPAFLIQKRFAYRDRRDKKNRVFVLGGEKS